MHIHSRAQAGLPRPTLLLGIQLYWQGRVGMASTDVVVRIARTCKVAASLPR